MKRSFVSGIAILVIFVLIACSSAVQSSPTDPAVPIQTDRISRGKNPVAAVVSIDYAGEDLLAHRDAFDEFIDDVSEHHVKVVFTANTIIKDFKFLEISFADIDQNGNIKFDVVKELYTLEELSPDRPVVIWMVFVGAIPNRGISYLDENGLTKYFMINMSGVDGSLLLSEF